MESLADSRAFIRNLNEKYRSWSDLTKDGGFDGLGDKVINLYREKVQNDDQVRREQEESLEQLQKTLKEKSGVDTNAPPTDWMKTFKGLGDSGIGLSQRGLDGLTNSTTNLVSSKAWNSLLTLYKPDDTTNGKRSLDSMSWKVQHALKESETRREQLVQKLNDAQEIIKKQSDKMMNLEYSMKDNSFEVDDLKYREKEARNKLLRIEHERNEYKAKMLECYRQKEEMQDKYRDLPLRILEFQQSSKNMVDDIDKQLNELKSQQTEYEGELVKKQDLLDQTTSSVLQLQSQNTSLQETKDSLNKEVSLLKETLDLAKRRNEQLESDLTQSQSDVENLKQENQSISSQHRDQKKRMEDLEDGSKRLKEECTTLMDGYKNVNEEKQRLLGEQSSLQNDLRNERSTIAILQKDKERLLTEIVSLNQQITAITLQKDRLEKDKMLIENQNMELHKELSSLGEKLEDKEEEIRELEEQLDETKKESARLKEELANTKSKLRQEQEKYSSSERSKCLLQERYDTQEGLYRTLERERSKLAKELQAVRRDLEAERDKVEDVEDKLKEELEKMKILQGALDEKSDEYTNVMEKTEYQMETFKKIHEEDISRWKTACDQLTAVVNKREEELQELQTTVKELREQNVFYKISHETHQSHYEQLVEAQGEMEKLHRNNRRLQQTCQENQQVIELLEMQKSFLRKAPQDHDSCARLEAEKLRTTVDRMTAEQELLKEKLKEADRAKQELISKKEKIPTDSHVLQSSSSPSFFSDASMEKLQKVERENAQLKMSVQLSTERLTKCEKENMELKFSSGMRCETVPKALMERYETDNQRLENDLSQVSEELATLEMKYHSLLKEQGRTRPETTASSTDAVEILKERDELREKMILLMGESVLMENSKKKLEKQVKELEEDLERCKSCLTSSIKNVTSSKMEGELECLKKQLQESKQSQEKQQKLLHTLKMQSLEDVSTELLQMRKELRRLLEIIEGKDREIQELDTKLRKAREEQIAKDNEIRDLKGRPTHDSAFSTNSVEDRIRSIETEREDLSRMVETLKLKETDYNRRLTEAKNQRNIALKDAADLREGMQDLKVMFEEEKRQVRSSMEEQVQLKDRHIADLKEKLRKANEDLIKYKSEARKCEILHFFPKTGVRKASCPNNEWFSHETGSMDTLLEPFKPSRKMSAPVIGLGEAKPRRGSRPVPTPLSLKESTWRDSKSDAEGNLSNGNESGADSIETSFQDTSNESLKCPPPMRKMSAPVMGLSASERYMRGLLHIPRPLTSGLQGDVAERDVVFESDSVNESGDSLPESGQSTTTSRSPFRKMSEPILSGRDMKRRYGRVSSPSPLALEMSNSENKESSQTGVSDSMYNSVETDSLPGSPHVSLSNSTTPGTDTPEDSGCDVIEAKYPVIMKDQQSSGSEADSDQSSGNKNSPSQKRKRFISKNLLHPLLSSRLPSRAQVRTPVPEIKVEETS